VTLGPRGQCAWVGSQRRSRHASPENQRRETLRIVETSCRRRKTPGGAYRTKLGHSIFLYRRGPESIFNGTQRYSFIECLSFFIQLLPALLHSADDEYPVIDD
jgi:hypothetical protein